MHENGRQLRATADGRDTKGISMSDLTLPGTSPSEESPFDSIRQTRADGTEFWSARDLAQVVEYESWRNFAAAIDRAKAALVNSGEFVTSHVADASKLVERPQGGSIRQEDFELSRFGAYLVVMNGDPRKPAIAAAQAYFAIRTRQAEVVEAKLTDAISTAKAQMELMRMAQGLIDPAHLECKARLVLARAMGEAPQLDPATTPLYAQSYLEEKGLSRNEIKSMSSVFGKRLKAMYQLEHGEDPKQYPLETKSGQIRPVNAYTESDRVLFDRVWEKYYGGAA
ncbi:BRO family protein [Rhodococcus sp. YH1]|uniref:BRO family protein n=1 Tax=Rhodococcus sp. YH1 TaxID=89066 RepID=UPI0013874999